MTKFFLLFTLIFAGISSSEIDGSFVIPESHSTVQESAYHSDLSNKELPYYYIEPKTTPTGIFIYMHGAGGKYEQGMSDELYAENFKNLKTYLSENNFLYVTPETTDFGTTGAGDLIDLIITLKEDHEGLSVYLSGASAGGRTIFLALQEAEKRGVSIDGAIFICPAISSTAINLSSEYKNIPVWIEIGEKDTVITPETANLLLNKFKVSDNPAHLNMIPGGDHNAPVEQIDWEKSVDFIK